MFFLAKKKVFKKNYHFFVLVEIWHKYQYGSWNIVSVGLMKHLWYRKQLFSIIVTYLS